ncbi:endoribonuclease L-PSP [Campylobacter sputorum subsp. bubulus]|uniref:Endoribonuclease L-PSP n=1 Tax=Campylobacter sputorum subsp. sputorum TaxID=32024 RepID=A0A381DHM3_9BACT|nr:RidA family protein [Campylobacter sputorum]ASM35209.1 reactive intermediate/imine deaminase [Campylobacter sputorum aubsp. sputorum RM3237]ASM36889.1 reactive intermediate/imine deaminase [Campylobacter sputorum bv. faecalis CCUG 20703]ASM38568.1 reactive intermediate/imine deaminase [Campylobacter sputorum bv. paraureolyticus LMG 11764]KAB0580982.1 RidA family protein [Campylobacter sputorum subsp. sputorum]MDY6120401.1 RidA family protein [Campylobacter sputorum]
MKKISTKNAPEAIGPYSQAVISNGFIFGSGQIPLTKDGELLSDDVVNQTHQVMKNISCVLQEAGSSLDNIVKTTIFLKNISDFAKVNEIYASYFKGEIKPARSTVGIANLPKDVLVEIEYIAQI